MESRERSRKCRGNLQNSRISSISYKLLFGTDKNKPTDKFYMINQAEKFKKSCFAEVRFNCYFCRFSNNNSQLPRRLTFQKKWETVNNNKINGLFGTQHFYF